MVKLEIPPGNGEFHGNESKSLFWKALNAEIFLRVVSFKKHKYMINWYLNSFPPNAAYMRQWIGQAMVHVMACRLFGAEPLS